jgi:membrane associated rhomboid family serine protease
MRESVSSQTRTLGWLSLGALIALAGSMVIWLARESEGVCQLNTSEACDSDPKSIAAVISLIAVLVSYGVFAVWVFFGRSVRERRIKVALCMVIGVVSLIGAVWTFVTGGFAIEFG